MLEHTCTHTYPAREDCTTPVTSWGVGREPVSRHPCYLVMERAGKLPRCTGSSCAPGDMVREMNSPETVASFPNVSVPHPLPLPLLFLRLAEKFHLPIWDGCVSYGHSGDVLDCVHFIGRHLHQCWAWMEGYVYLQVHTHEMQLRFVYRLAETE